MSTAEPHQNEEIASAIRALGIVFLNRLPTTLVSMLLDIERLEKNRGERQTWQTLHRQLHSLAGSSGTFGYAELGSRARALEQRIIPQLMDAPPESTELLADLREFTNWAATCHSAAQPEH